MITTSFSSTICIGQEVQFFSYAGFSVEELILVKVKAVVIGNVVVVMSMFLVAFVLMVIGVLY